MRHAMMIALVAMTTGCATVGPGQAGVVWHAGGGTDARALGEGMHAVKPFDEVTIYDLRTQQKNEQLAVLASNGLSLALDTTIRYRIVPSEVTALHKEVGPTYYDIILNPVLRSQARRVVGRYTPEEIYSTKRELIEREMREAVEKAAGGKHILLEAILVRNVQLPAMIQGAIIDKLAEEQKSLKMKFVLERELQEATRKKLEAQGIADYQNIISAKLSDSFLRWKQIEALDRLALSNNAKVVMLGGRDTPMLLDPSR